MKFAVDPWDPSYGSSVDNDMAPSDAVVITDVEVEAKDWAPIDPPSATEIRPAVIFVDGVRRLLARAWLDQPDGIALPGIFGSYAAGTVRCEGTTAKVDHITVGHGIYSPADDLTDVVTKHVTFKAKQTAEASPEALTFALHDDMAASELVVAEAARRSGNELIILDGPIRKRGHIRDAVGFIKSHNVKYLPPELDVVVAKLGAGQRTPLFRIESPPFGRAAWYLRLPCTIDTAWAGVVRCEATGAIPTRELAALADTVTAMVPRFASQPHKDTRAPQNLYPIAGLERDLRHHLGDQKLLYRALRLAAAT